MFQNITPNFQDIRNSLFKNGFFTIDSFIDISAIPELKLRLETLESTHGNKLTKYPGIYKDNDGNVIVMNKIEQADLFFYDLARNPFILDFSSKLLGKPVIPLMVEYFAKTPHGKLITPAHQDQFFYEDHFDDELAITFWIALDNIVNENGALEYSVPDGLTLLPHKKSNVLGFSYEIETSSLINLPVFQTATVPSGGCIVHHAYSIHRANDNRTSLPRKALAFTYRTSSYRAYYAT